MKTHVVALMLVLASAMASAQTYYIDWAKPNPVTGTPSVGTLKRDGVIRNSTQTTKELYFRYNIDEVDFNHRAQLCMSLCWTLFPGEDNPFDREGQVLTATGSIPIYIDLITGGNEGNSTIKVTLFDKTDANDKLDFDVQFVVSNNASVRTLEDAGITTGPIPTTESLQLKGASLIHVVRVGLYDLSGSLLRSYGPPTADHVTYPLDGLSSGSYRLMLTMANGSSFGTPVVIAR